MILTSLTHLFMAVVTTISIWKDWHNANMAQNIFIRWVFTCIAIFALALNYISVVKDKQKFEDDKKRLEQIQTQDSEIKEELKTKIEILEKQQMEVSKHTSYLFTERQWSSHLDFVPQSVLDKTIKATFGSNSVEFGNKEGSATLWKSGEWPIITARSDGRKLFVSLVVYDRDGRIVAKVIDNQVFLNLQNVAWKDIQKNKIIITNMHNEVSLLIKCSAPGAIIINGTFYLKGRCWLATDHGLQSDPSEEQKRSLLPEYEKMKAKGFTFLATQ